MLKIKEFVKARDEMLMKKDINELRKFVKESEFYDEPFKDNFLKASDLVVEITLNKMICSVISLPFEMRKESAKWLNDRGYSEGWFRNE